MLSLNRRGRKKKVVGMIAVAEQKREKEEGGADAGVKVPFTEEPG